MVCPVPAYDGPELQLDLIPVSLFVKNSDGKSSETHAFFYKHKPNLGKKIQSNFLLGPPA